MRAPLRVFSSALVPALLGLAGCAGTISLDGPDDFGIASSAAVLELDYDGGGWNVTLASNRSGLCDDLVTAYADLDVAWEVFTDSNQEDADCDTLWSAAGEAWAPVFGDHLLVVTQYEGTFLDPASWTEVHAGDREIDDGEVVLASRTYPDGGPLAVVADAAPGCTWGDAATDAVESYVGSDGAITFTADGDRWELSGSGALEDEDGDSAGTFEVDFAAEVCPASADVDVLGMLAYGLVFLPFNIE